MSLGLAEAYNMYTVLSFLQRYLATFPLVLPANYTVQVYCDNKGLVDWLNCKTTHKYPWDAIQDDYTIIGEIQQTLQNLQPITITINHIKGHQDKAKLNWPLTIPENLNINSDKQANKAMLIYQEKTPANHPMTPTRYPHLIINGAVQFWQMQQQLHNTATHSEYQKYLQTKFLWNKEQYESIQWQAFQIAFQWLATNERQIISKLTHKWLPLQASHICSWPTVLSLLLATSGNTQTLLTMPTSHLAGHMGGISTRSTKNNHQAQPTATSARCHNQRILAQPWPDTSNPTSPDTTSLSTGGNAAADQPRMETTNLRMPHKGMDDTATHRSSTN